MSNRATPTTTTEYTANTPYSEAAYVRITLESLEDATLAWHELIDTLAYLADMTGARANTKGLRNADAEAIPLSLDIGSGAKYTCVPPPLPAATTSLTLFPLLQ